MAYPEGCPTHPSYPAAHAVNAGACATILKAFVNENYEIQRPLEASADGVRLEPWRGECAGPSRRRAGREFVCRPILGGLHHQYARI
jgi:hypothetical protein